MKKTLSILLTVAALMTVLAGCSSNETAPAEESQSESAGESEVDEVSSASVKESAEPEDVVNGLSENGYWIFALLDDVAVEGDLKVEGVFHNRGDESEAVYRKLALYAQDGDRNITAEYTLKVGRMLVDSPNFRIQNGTVVGDIYVTGEGFELAGTTLEGNLFFATQELMDGASLEDGVVTGETAIGEAVEAEMEQGAEPAEENQQEDTAEQQDDSQEAEEAEEDSDEEAAA